MVLLDIVFLEMSQKRLPPLEQLVVSKDIVVKIGLVVVMTMDIALILLVDSQVLLETMGLFGFYIAV